MKKILYFLVPVLLLFVSCRKDYPVQVIDESQWLNRERAVVVYSDPQCPFYVVETYGSYSVLRNRDGFVPFQGSVMYGNFNNWGIRTFYNRTDRYLTQADVTQYWLTYWEAMDEVYYQCRY